MRGEHKNLVIIRNIIRYSFISPKKYFRGNEKSGIRIFIELFYHFLRKGEFNDMYYAFGLNIKGKMPEDFIGKKEMNRYIETCNQTLRGKQGISQNIGYDIIAKDKFYLTSLLQSNNIPVIPNIGLITGGAIIEQNGNKYGIEHLFNYNFPLVIKNTILEYNEGIILLERKGENIILNGKILVTKDILFNRIVKGQWVIQYFAKSSKEICRVNDTALNTTRIITVYGKANPEYLAGFQTFATNCQNTDSWGKGAVYVGFDPGTEKLWKYGYFHPSNKISGLVTEHPDSKIKFEDYKIPGLSEAIDLCKNAHRFLYYMYLIGWDVAITEEGPKILEANEKPGMNAVQCIEGGLRKSLAGYSKTASKVSM
jgi:hypothetical protein